MTPNMAKWAFLMAKDARILGKESEYGGKDNPLNYMNMSMDDLWKRLDDTYETLLIQSSKENPETELIRKKLIDLSNFCQFLWERLGWK